jgi:membrane protease subunit HflC
MKLGYKILTWGLGILSTIAALRSVYTVHQTEHAVITKFGAPEKVIYNPLPLVPVEDQQKILARYEELGIPVDTSGPGLKFKSPLQSVYKISNQVMNWAGSSEDAVATRDKKFIWVDTMARWIVEDPLLYSKSLHTLDRGFGALDDIIDSHTMTVIRRNDLIESVRSTNREIVIAEEELKKTMEIEKIEKGRAELTDEILSLSKKSCGENEYGNGLLDFDVQRITYKAEVRDKVFERMVSERNRIKEKYLSEGREGAAEVNGEMEKSIKEIQSEAYREAEGIRGEGDAEAAKIYAQAYNQNPELYKFLKSVEVLRALPEGTRLVVSTDSALYASD